jgi:hypothetical protein
MRFSEKTYNSDDDTFKGLLEAVRVELKKVFPNHVIVEEITGDYHAIAAHSSPQDGFATYKMTGISTIALNIQLQDLKTMAFYDTGK